MSQVVFTSIDPDESGTVLATQLNAFKDALMSGLSGTSRPSQLAVGGSWVDMTNNPTSWDFKIYTGTSDVTIFTINLTSGIASVALAVDQFIVKKVSADTTGAILQLVKNRIASSGQVKDGDVVGEIRMIGRTLTAGNPVVAKIIWTATDDQTSLAYGGTLSFYSTPDASATLTEHMRLITGYVETVVPHKLNSQVLVSQNIATAATITQMSASKIVAEMTGSTATSIQGVNSTHDSKVVTIHNRSSASVTINHENSGALAVDRIKLPNSTDYVLIPDATATLYYCTADTRWKLLSTSDKISGYTRQSLYGQTQTLVVPSNVTSLRLRAYTYTQPIRTESSMMLDYYGNAYAWGINTNGQLGVGDVIPRSSPVAVLGGLIFKKTYGTSAVAGNISVGLTNQGAAYAWGLNTNGQLGVGDVIARSSPVAVLGGLRFGELVVTDASVIALGTNGRIYSWGINTNGQLGLGDVIPRSSPVAVLGGLAFNKVSANSPAAASASYVALTKTGVAYAWGVNTNGNLGDGTVVAKSSPVAVLGGLTFSDVNTSGSSSRGFVVGLTTAGAAYAWGSNTNSNLGVGDQNSRSSPVAVLGGLTFTKIIMHNKSETVFGLTAAGALYGWGLNANGQIGDGTVVNKSSPVAVLGGLVFADVYLFRSAVVGLTSDGTAYAWGLNDKGQLGVGDIIPRSSPVAVLGGLKFKKIGFDDGTTDIYSVAGITTDGIMYMWGANANGTLGVGDVVGRSSPVAVLGATNPDSLDRVRTSDLTVTAGASYTVTLGPTATFGNNQIGYDISRLDVEYLQ